MSFLLLPAKTVMPVHPLAYTSDNPLMYKGIGADARLYAFRAAPGYVISEYVAPSLKVDGEIFSPEIRDINGCIYWRNSSSYIYRSPLSEYFVINSYFPGYPPEEYHSEVENAWCGDIYWQGSLPGAGETVDFAPCGEAKRENVSKNVSWYWPRWQSGTQLGEYLPCDGQEGVKIFGTAHEKEDGSIEYVMGEETAKVYIAEVAVWR